MNESVSLAELQARLRDGRVEAATELALSKSESALDSIVKYSLISTSVDHIAPYVPYTRSRSLSGELISRYKYKNEEFHRNKSRVLWPTLEDIEGLIEHIEKELSYVRSYRLGM